MKQIITTQNAPAAIGTYSQAVKAENTVYISGQIPLIPETMNQVEGDFKARAKQVFSNINAIARAAGGNLNNIVKITVYLTDMADFSQVNEVMMELFQKPYPARAVVAVKELPKKVDIEIDAILFISE